MPGVYRQGDINSVLQQAFQRLRALETQQQMILSNLQGLSVMAFGLIPGSNPQRYGLEAVNPNNGGPLCFLGYDSGLDTAVEQFSNAAGQVTCQIDAEGFHFYDASGTERTLIDVNGTHYYGADGHELVRVDDTGLTVFDDSMNPRVVLGLLSNGDYGLATYSLSNDGSYQEEQPLSADSVAGTLTTTSTIPVDLGGPSVTATVGASGKVDIRASAFIGSSATNQSCYVDLYQDGALVNQWLGLSNNAGGPLAVSCNNGRVLTDVSPGSHTWKLMYYQTLPGATVAFSSNSLEVQPL